MQLLRGRRERRLDGAEHLLPIHALLTRDRVHQHQQFAVHSSGPPTTPSACGSSPAGTAGAGANRRPLKSTTGTSRASRTSSSEKSSACSPFPSSNTRRQPPSASPALSLASS